MSTQVSLYCHRIVCIPISVPCTDESHACVWCIYLIYKAEIVCVCVCVRDKRAPFLLRRPQTRCGCWVHRGSGYSGVDVARLAVGRELSVHFRFFLRGRRPFSNSVFTGFDSLSSYVRI